MEASSLSSPDQEESKGEVNWEELKGQLEISVKQSEIHYKNLVESLP